MAVSGYLLQVVPLPAWLPAIVGVHVVASLVFLIGYLAHLMAWLRGAPRPGPARVPADPALEA
jgi:hypothetical protein